MEDYCDAPGNCTQDDLIFKGVYFHHLDLFCEPLPTETPLVPGVTQLASSGLAASHASTCAGFAPWIQHNAWAALNTKNASNIIGEWWGASYLNQTQGMPTRMLRGARCSVLTSSRRQLPLYTPRSQSQAALIFATSPGCSTPYPGSARMRICATKPSPRGALDRSPACRSDPEACRRGTVK